MSSYGLFSLSIITIALGAHSSLHPPKHIQRIHRKLASLAPSEDDLEDEDIQSLKSSDALLFPVAASTALVSIYLSLQYFPKRWINLFFNSYFSIIGILALTMMGVKAAKGILRTNYFESFSQYRLTLAKNKLINLIDFKLSSPEIISFLIACIITISSKFFPSWQVDNLIALSLGFNAITLLRIDTFLTGSTLLSGLFFYDFFWVFYSDRIFRESVMIAVAQNLDGPIKIIWPRNKGFSLLGLGDIVLPGIFVALALRFDYSQALKKAAIRKESPPTPSSAFARPYFLACFISYMFGLIITFIISTKFKQAQPALLYLSPACIGSVFIIALLRGEWKDLMAFDDENIKFGFAGEESLKQEVAMEEKEKHEVEEKEPIVEVSNAMEGRVLRSRIKKVA